MDISIIIPVYNEENNIGPLFAEIREILDKLGKSCETIFVNDGSTDKTLRELKKVRESDPRVKIINFNRNFGQTPAIMAGFEHSKGEIIILMDGDMQNDPRDIPKLIDKLDSGFDLVSGWRRKRKDSLLLRVLPSKLANRLISVMLKVPLHDYGCTLKAYNRDVIKDIHLYGEMHRFIPAIAGWKGARITELEVNHRARKYGKAKYGLNRTIKVLLDLMLIAFLSEYSTKPIRFFGGLGIISSAMGFLTLLIVIYMKLANLSDMTGNPLLILSVLFFLVSVQLISMGFLGEINIRTYYESQGKKTYHIKEIIE
ncbi:MAG: glycosyltransferase family 2 protein [Candidatus Omnitrophota bacterium]|nr:glycosyltransferase family 2 protein [Candidatus Omnitrophota bacterium]